MKLNRLSQYILSVILLNSGITVYAQDSNEINIIINNFRNIYVNKESDKYKLTETLIKNQPGYEGSDRVIVELQQLVPNTTDKISRYIGMLNNDGSWKDINYKDKKRSGWEPRLHAERILELVIAYSKNSPFSEKKLEEIEDAIHKSMDYWFKSKLICPNWWYNQIGMPRTLGTAFVIFKNRMSEQEISNAIKVMDNSKIGMTGQNKVWLAANVMMKGILANDMSLIEEARSSIVSEIVTGKKEGIKDDWSFHQHGSQQQFGNYGLAYIYYESLIRNIFKYIHGLH